ncbi:MAG TPA: SGNH/GDSL hydrolase family protein [Aquihabitans sp.]|mgnify:CR=1 FL=1|nr:SGNH/GDSL hydrolase family protein [Aquihabitans sp.]
MALVALLAAIASFGCGNAEPQISGLPYWPEAFVGQAHAEQMFRDQTHLGQRDDDELLFAGADHRSATTNQVGYERVGLAGEGPVVWFIGGSTTFGMGQRDDHTVPSEVVRLSSAAGRPIVARNFGYPTYVAWQEAILLDRLLASEEPPDLIVVYHGSNDYAALCRELELGDPPGGHDNFLLDPKPEHPKAGCTDDPAAIGRVLDGIVAEGMAEMRAAAGEVPVLEFWQPYAATRPASADHLALLARLGQTADSAAAHRGPYLAAIGSASRPVIDLTDVFDEVDGPIYFDWVHTNERGAQIVADAMWDRGLRQAVAALG